MLPISFIRMPQDLTTLSAVEDVFYALSDRKPCGELTRIAATARSATMHASGCTKAHKPPPASSSSRAGKPAGGAGSSAGKQQASSPGAAGSNAAVGGGAGSQPNSSSSSHREGEAGHHGGKEDGVVLQPDLIVAEQFPEAPVRLACVRYRCARDCDRSRLLWAAGAFTHIQP